MEEGESEEGEENIMEEGESEEGEENTERFKTKTNAHERNVSYKK